MELGDVYFASARSGEGKCNSPGPNGAIWTGPTDTSFHQANSTGKSRCPAIGVNLAQPLQNKPTASPGQGRPNANGKIVTARLGR